MFGLLPMAITVPSPVERTPPFIELCNTVRADLRQEDAERLLLDLCVLSSGRATGWATQQPFSPTGRDAEEAGLKPQHAHDPTQSAFAAQMAKARAEAQAARVEAAEARSELAKAKEGASGELMKAKEEAAHGHT